MMISDPLFPKCDDKALMGNVKGPDIQSIKRHYRLFKATLRSTRISQPSRNSIDCH